MQNKLTHEIYSTIKEVKILMAKYIESNEVNDQLLIQLEICKTLISANHLHFHF